MNHLKDKMGSYYANSIITSRLIKRKTLYGFDADKEYNFIIINLPPFNA